MGFPLLILYILLMVMSPAETFRELEPFHLGYWAGILGILVSAGALVIRGWAFTRMPQFWLLMMFTTIMCLSTMIGLRYLGAPLAVMSGFSLSLIIFLLIVWNVDSMKRMKWTAFVIVVSALALSAQGLYSAATGWNSVRLLMPFVNESAGQDNIDHDEEYMDAKVDIEKTGDEDAMRQLYYVAKEAALSNGTVDFRIRGNGVMQDPNDLALGVVTSLPFCWLAWKKGKKIRNLLIVCIPTGLMLTCVYYTRSRGGIVSLMAALGVLFFRRVGTFKTCMLLGVVVVGMLGMKVTGGRAMMDESSEGRLDAWSAGYQMFLHSPILGVGYNEFTQHNTLTAHNSYVLCFSELGVTGYFCWTGILVVTLMQISALRKLTGSPMALEISRWASALQVAMAGFMAGAFFLSRTYVYLFYMLVAMTCGLLMTARKNGFTVEIPFQKCLKPVLTVEFASLVGIYIVMRVGK